MKMTLSTLVMATTVFAVAPGAWAARYDNAIEGCKSAIEQQAGGDKVMAFLGDVRKKGSDSVQLDFRVKITKGGESTRTSARCLAKRSGEVLSLTFG